MTQLDLHGVKHQDVDRLVENFIYMNCRDFPLKIICGNSVRMIQLVETAINRIECDYIELGFGNIIVQRFR